jgi:hypothetical protein
VKVRKIKDPTFAWRNQEEEELSILNPESVPKLKSITLRETLPSEFWAAGKFESTTYGVSARMLERPTLLNEENTIARSNQSHIVFDHFNIQQGKAVVDAEMPRGKRIDPIYT